MMRKQPSVSRAVFFMSGDSIRHKPVKEKCRDKKYVIFVKIYCFLVILCYYRINLSNK